MLLIDDHQIVTETLSATLSQQDGIEIVGIASSGGEGIEATLRLRPDVVLVDFGLPDMTGADVIRALAEQIPSVRCVVLTGQERVLEEVLEAGAFGFVTKYQRLEDVTLAIRAAARGEMSVSSRMVGRLIGQSGSSTSALTPREIDVLSLMARGMSNGEIAIDLNLSVNTIRNHVANILTKPDVRSRLNAVAKATREGLVPPGGVQ